MAWTDVWLHELERLAEVALALAIVSAVLVMVLVLAGMLVRLGHRIIVLRGRAAYWVIHAAACKKPHRPLCMAAKEQFC